MSKYILSEDNRKLLLDALNCVEDLVTPGSGLSYEEENICKALWVALMSIIRITSTKDGSDK